MIYTNIKPIRLIELFAGIGSQAKALTNLGVDFEHWRVCEFDNYAINSYNAVHGTNFTTSDITKLTANDLSIVDTEHFTYLLTYSFPCQDLSNAGKGAGMEKGSGTRSGLLWEVERLLNECNELPQVLLMENVPQVHGKKNKEHFDKWIAFLESKGYSNYWQDLNAKDYGIPQNRNRCFMVSILGEYTFEFPEPIPLTLKLGDMLEKEVDEKYYLSDKAIQGRMNTKFHQYGLENRIVNNMDVHPTILARFDGAPTLYKEETKCQVR
jgi:DNA (cytosine-5)-methyltransferase 1